MTPEQLGARFTELAGAAGISGEVGVSGGGAFARATVAVRPADWPAAVVLVRDELACDFFDWLSAVDELADGFTVVAHLWSTTARHGLLLSTGVPLDSPALASIVPLFPGAAWHERETHEMFGIDFPGHPGPLRPLLLPPEFEGYPLRKAFVLASRVAKPWPGAKEPGESHDTGAARRAPMRPPGVPAPGEWGPPGAAPEPTAPPTERPARDRPVRERAAAQRRPPGTPVPAEDAQGAPDPGSGTGGAPAPQADPAADDGEG
jgi:NADH-quinone oxidoreductase subunit C